MIQETNWFRRQVKKNTFVTFLQFYFNFIYFKIDVRNRNFLFCHKKDLGRQVSIYILEKESQFLMET
jgi:hypothetical protein